MEIKNIKFSENIPCINLRLVLINANPNNPLAVLVDNKSYLPYLISESEQIEDKDYFVAKNGYGDWIVDLIEKGMERFLTFPKRSFSDLNSSNKPHQGGEFKIIIMPEQMSDQLLKDISAKIVTSESILVAKCKKEIDQHPDWIPSYSDPDNSALATITWYTIELDENKKVILF